MPADFTIRQGATLPTWTYQLTRADGSNPNLAGATVTLNLRQLTSTGALTLTGTTVAANPGIGQVTYAPSAADTATPGLYEATFTVTYGGGGIEVFPPTGYLSVSIEPNLTATGTQQIVSLPDVKDYLAAAGLSVDHSRDAKLVRYINAATPLIENAVGPVVVRMFEEWHVGGQYSIKLRRRPSTAIGSNPVLVLMACEEYRGPIPYPLKVVTDPAAATIYSVMLEPKTGTVFRRSTGGGLLPFGAGPWGGGMPQAVHVVYEAGQSPIPANVQEAALEIVRENYERTQATGAGSRALADLDGAAYGGRPPAFYMPRTALELLSPMRRHSAIA